MSFEPNDQEGQAEQKPTFNVGDRTYDPESAAKKIENADLHIAQLEQERQADRADLEAMKEELEKYKELQAQLTSKQELEETTPQEPTVDVEKLVEQKLSERERVQTAKQTFESTQQALVDLFGSEGIDQAISDKLKEVDAGITLEDATAMASDPKQSKMLLKVLGAKPKSQPNFSTSSLSTLPNEKKVSQGAKNSIEAVLSVRNQGKKPLGGKEARSVLESLGKEIGVPYQP